MTYFFRFLVSVKTAPPKDYFNYLINRFDERCHLTKIKGKPPIFIGGGNSYLLPGFGLGFGFSFLPIYLFTSLI
jgi:hypothetical protein